MRLKMMNSGTERKEGSQDRLMNEFRTLVRDSENLIRLTGDNDDRRTRRAREKLSESLEAAREACEEMREEGGTRARRVVDDTVRTVKRHPYGSAGIAVLAGVCLGTLFFLRE